MSTGTGTVIGGRYHLRHRIGRGGMAVVHLAEDERLERQVALKLLDRAAAPGDVAEDRFAREARRAAGLNHPNIVQVHDTGVDLGHPFIVMELVEGPNLADVIAGEAPLPPRRVVDIATQICDALEAAHEAGLVHRDIKPSNVLFDHKGRLKLADFGLAKAYAGDTVTQGSPMGSAAYVSPEQISDQEVDHRADLFSLGVMLYEMATGVRPYQGDTAAATAVQRLARQPAPPSEHVEIPQRLEAVIMRLLSRDPDDRFDSAGDVAAALRGVDDDTATLPIIVNGDTTTGGTKRRWLVGLVVAAAVALVGAFVWPDGSGGRTVVTPDVSGMTIDAATRVLEDAGLAVGDVREEPTDDTLPGLVLSQTPEQGVPVGSGIEVDLVVAAEPVIDTSSSPSPSPSPTSSPAEGTSGTSEGAAATDGGTTDTSGDTSGDTTGDTTGGTSDGTQDPPDNPGHGGTPPGQGGEPPGRGNG